VPIHFKMPELAESVVEGEILKWFVKEGDRVQKDQPLVEIMTDKVTVEVPSPYEGVVLKLLHPEGAIVPVHEDMAIIGAEGEAAGVEVAAPAAAAPSPKAPTPPALRAAETPAEGDGGRPLAAPAVRKLAREKGVDLSGVRGSGEGGRITREDVEAAAAGRAAAPAPAAERRVAVEMRGLESRRVPLRGLRRRIAQQMVTAKRTAAHTLSVDEVDCTNLVEMRARMKPEAERRGVKLTYLPFIIKAVLAGIREYPTVNASLDDEKQEVVYHGEVNVGIAIATKDGLVVPVIGGVETLSILEIARRIEDLAARANAGKLSVEDVTGGTFTITNIGSIGALFSFPVINVPEVCILGVHTIQKRPVVQDDRIVVRHMMYLSTAFDHRVVDGAEAALFSRVVKRYVEEPELLLLEGL
jgi:pyruvate dehydrogenase E2 component (dihydrolipoamide acetyltransferase)